MELYTVYRILIRIRRLKWLWWSLGLLAVLGYSAYQAYTFIDKEFCVAKELPFYDVGPRPSDDTLRVAVIGDSWAEWHMTLNCDTLFEQYGRRLTQQPIKCMTRGIGGAKSKDAYYYMFRSQTQEYSWMHDICTQPLLEEHPDYCVVMVGINDAWKKRPVSYYTGNYRLIIRLLLANHIRPVVMEIPDFDLTGWLDIHQLSVRIPYRIYSYFNGVVEDDITPFRDGLREMLKETGLGDSVLFIPKDRWIPKNEQYSEEIYQQDHVHINYQGYHVLDSCIVSEIIDDYHRRTN
ncbi:MAG: SGNH/GDSL hydrolase family protein [Prevotella sp.]|nr:SGNH/GDSL hydrolase family protein [Prevotella sp.]